MIILIAILTFAVLSAAYFYASKEIYNAFYDCYKCEHRDECFRKLMLFGGLRCKELDDKENEDKSDE